MDELKIVQERLDKLDIKINTLGNLVQDERKAVKVALQELINLRAELSSLIKDSKEQSNEMTSLLEKINIAVEELQGKYNQVNPYSKKLSVSDETLYKLKYIQGKSWSTLADMYGVSVSTIKRSVQRYQREQMSLMYKEVKNNG